MTNSQYLPPVPQFTGIKNLQDISLWNVVPFIRWNSFFRAWQIKGNFKNIETLCDCASCKTAWLQQFPLEEQPKAEEALKLFRDAQEMLRWLNEEKNICLNASLAFYPAYSQDNDIIILQEKEKTVIPTLRQQTPSGDGFCYSLADFIAPKNDFIGLFVTTVSHTEELAKKLNEKDNLYHSIMLKLLSDRLAEATSEWLHFQVRKTYWGYSPNEELNVERILKNTFRGIRPAVGYPSLPDQSIIFKLASLLDFEKTGVHLTENGAMLPNSSVCGLYFSHPKSRYFMVGKIDATQLENYAKRRKKTVDDMKKWLHGVF